MNTDQINSIVRSALKIIGSILIAHGMTSTADFINTPDVVGIILAFVGLLWSHVQHSGPDTPPVPPIGPKLSALLLVGFLLAGAGCASLNSNTFTAEQAAASSADAAMRAYSTYWDKAWADPAAFHRTAAALTTERQSVEAASIKVGASIELVENLRATYQTNSAVEPQLTAALTALTQNAGNVVSLVNTFININTNAP